MVFKNVIIIMKVEKIKIINLAYFRRRRYNIVKSVSVLLTLWVFIMYYSRQSVLSPSLSVCVNKCLETITRNSCCAIASPLIKWIIIVIISMTHLYWFVIWESYFLLAKRAFIYKKKKCYTLEDIWAYIIVFDERQIFVRR